MCGWMKCACACAAAAMLAACSSGKTGGPVAGAQDTHCTAADGGSIVQPTSQASCSIASDGGTTTPDYGDTRYNAESDDDDCKYHVKWTSSAIS